jgi:hypothetical protein
MIPDTPLPELVGVPLDLGGATQKEAPRLTHATLPSKDQTLARPNGFVSQSAKTRFKASRRPFRFRKIPALRAIHTIPAMIAFSSGRSCTDKRRNENFLT